MAAIPVGVGNKNLKLVPQAKISAYLPVSNAFFLSGRKFKSVNLDEEGQGNRTQIANKL
jgi:hypothetical protein